MPSVLDHSVAPSPTSSELPQLPPPPRSPRRTRNTRTTSNKSPLLYLCLMVATLVLTPVLIFAGSKQGYAQVLAALVALVALAMIPWRPILGLYLIVICAVTIEQEPLTATPIGTDHLYIFYWPNQLQGLPERPIGFFILAVLAIIVLARLIFHQRPLYGGRLFYPFIFFLGCVAMGILHGVASSGTFRIIILEVRPFWYLFVCYILAFNIVSKVEHVRTILWITVIGTAIKGVQGTYIVYDFLGGHIEGHNEIMAHEQSFFFILVLLLLALMFIYRMQRRFLLAILLSLPCLLIALVANNRRADYVALLAGVAVAWVLIIVLRPETRRVLITALVICLLLGSGYVLAFKNSSGPVALPARAVISVFSPSATDTRDALSNAYRTTEDYDLKFTESKSPILGYGFGKPFLQPVPLPNVVQLDPYYLYIPHNNILWVWMRLGPLGFGAFWYLFGTAIIAGCLIARRLKNPQLQLFAIFAIATIVMEVIVAYSDYQLFFYRNMIYIGVLLGILLKLPAIERNVSATSAQPSNPNIALDVDADEPDNLDNLDNTGKPARRRSRLYTPVAIPLLPVPSASTMTVMRSSSSNSTKQNKYRWGPA